MFQTFSMPAAFLHHDRVEEGRGGQPRQQRDVLDRVPAPVAAPAEDVVRPPAAQQDAGPRIAQATSVQRRTKRSHSGVHAPRDQRAGGDGERHREARHSR